MSMLVKPLVQLISGINSVWKSLSKNIGKDTANLVFVTLTMLFVFITMLFALLIAAIAYAKFIL
jgi:hypothetical protein